MLFLDRASTSKYIENRDDFIVDAIINAMKNQWTNPSSLYSYGVSARKEIDCCRAVIARFINAKPEEIVFTSGASESNNMAIRGWVDQELSGGFKAANIITTPIEHKSILECLKNKSLCASVRYCDIDKCGLVDINSLKSLLWLHEGESILVSICMANNEIGTIQDIKTISDVVHKYGGILHVDATQSFSCLPINVKELGIDMMSVSGHKVSPVLKGIGFLYKSSNVKIRPLIYGSQESGLRGGTENTFGIIGLSKAVEYCDISQDKIDEMCQKRDYFINLLKSRFSKFGFGVKLNGCATNRLPNNINVTLPQNITGEALLYTLDLDGIQIGTGSACNSASIEPSYVLKAIGLTDEEAMRTIRLTFDSDITYEDIDYVVDQIDKAIKIIES